VGQLGPPLLGFQTTLHERKPAGSVGPAGSGRESYLAVFAVVVRREAACGAEAFCSAVNGAVGPLPPGSVSGSLRL
jgi:hypothetical protein